VLQISANFFVLATLLSVVTSAPSIVFATNARSTFKNTSNINANTNPNINENGENFDKINQYGEAIKKWQEMLDFTDDLDEKALIYRNLGIAYRQMGKTSEAIAQWQKAVTIYQFQNASKNVPKNVPKNAAFLTTLLIDQAQAYIAIGQQKEAVSLLQRLVSEKQDLPDPKNENISLAKGVLGNAYLGLGQYNLAIAAYQESIDLTNKPQILAAGWLNLGKAEIKSAERYQNLIQVESAEGNRPEVIKLQKLRDQALADANIAYQRSLTQGSESLIKSKALINLAHLVQNYPRQDDQGSQIRVYLQQASDLLAIAAPSRSKIYTLIDLANLYQRDSGSSQLHLLEQALKVSETIGDARSKSFVLGAIGKVYEQQREFAIALKYTNQAQWLAQGDGSGDNSADSLYRWQWQSGRILKAMGERVKSLEAYRQAIATLQSMRSNIVAADRSFQLVVRDEVEPVYRELIELLLSESSSSSHTVDRPVGRPVDRQSIIEEALQVYQLLRLSELQNFFGDECLQTEREPRIKLEVSQKSQQNFAQIYTIILQKQSYIVLRLPDNSLKSYLVPLPKGELQNKIKYLRYTLENVATNEYLTPAKEIYDLLIRPIEKDLERSPAQLLAFVNDGILQTVPMAALYDGKQFLIQKYPIIYLVGSSLTDGAVMKTTNSNSTNFIAFGLSEAIAPFGGLENVLEEIKEIEKIWQVKIKDQNRWQIFLNRDFTFESFQNQVKKGYGTIHLATHARFGATPETTFLQAFDQRINLEQLETILRSSKTQIELLILSACQTAVGDNRATLGLAGVALRSGVQNVLATLWSVNDAEVVPVVKNFYTAWQTDDLTMAKALQKSQIQSITQDYLHPAIWSAFILVSN